ncbi:MAG: hypothetical protein KIS78_14575 [Labilithrix sp.]|nr:hypothetical protein [Labilithrix sp.]MCW5833624.1 hypothetical protein [Labilithrix sp.]
MPRNKRVTRVVYGVYVVVVAAFVVSNIAQVASALFGEPDGAAAAQSAPKVGPACAKILGEQLAAIEEARQRASAEATAEAAKARYETERSATRSPELERVCSGDPRGDAARASLARLERVAESQAVRTATELRPVRLSAQSFISGHPR